jgi:glyoxylase-like metal-dependent hydrolase (beta-lactamase superfamily II)
MSISVHGFTVGPVEENSYIVIGPGGGECVIVDPGDEPDRLLGAFSELEVECKAILLTHTHFDHVGAVAPVARATGAEVWCPEIEQGVLANIMDFVPWPGFGPFESWNAEHLIQGGETLSLAGMEIGVIHTPGHSPGHVTFVFDEGTKLLSGDVLFQGSVGRVDLPGGDGPTLISSIAGLLDQFPDEAVVHPGHGPLTTLGAERATNPFLQSLSS